MPEAKAQPKPLEVLEAALPNTTNRELLTFAVEVLCEGSRRAENYAALVEESGVPEDVLNEGYAFTAQFREVWGNGSLLSHNHVLQEARMALYDAAQDLTQRGILTLEASDA